MEAACLHYCGATLGMAANIPKASQAKLAEKKRKKKVSGMKEEARGKRRKKKKKNM